MDAVERWFGAGFAQLHPLLQRLHRDGGSLAGVVTLEFGRGPGGWLGRRIARRLGLPSEPGRVGMRVDIRSDAHALYWDRRFDDGAAMRSVFRPVGAWPNGVWSESTGPMRLALKVDTAGGGWRWRQSALWYRGLRLPLAFAPRVDAAKAIENGRYAFRVAIAMPLLGPLLAYGGVLDLDDGNNLPH